MSLPACYLATNNNHAFYKWQDEKSREKLGIFSVQRRTSFVFLCIFSSFSICVMILQDIVIFLFDSFFASV